MLKNFLNSVSIGLALAISAQAQMSEAETRNIPFPPPKPYTAVKVFQYTGDYLYTTLGRSAPTENTYLRTMTYSDYDYFAYLGTRGKRLYVWIRYNGTPATTGGACEHTHLNYGAKGYYAITYMGNTYNGWTWVGGGTQSGDWNATTNTCNRSVNNSLGATLPIFGWGDDLINVPGTIISGPVARYIDLVSLAVMAPTHGVGDCEPLFNPNTGFAFKMCLDDARVDAWTLPL